MLRFKEALLFLIVSLLSCVAVFQDAMWGRSLAAPVDLAPALWKHYQYVDPGQGSIPKNHYTVDQLSYDLPLQYLIYNGWRNGEVPWWNPYSSGGRPLLADAHCNGTDPIRLAVYFTVPDFVLAYNWTLILHAVGTGLGCFLLLREFGVRASLAGLCALAAQWAGGYVLYIGHPWVRGSFLYYPFLWIAWHRAMRMSRISVSASFLVAAILYAGNLQSHAYLPFFWAAAGAGYAGMSRPKWMMFLRATLPVTALGVLMAAPVLIPQIELYHLNSRTGVENALAWHWLETAAVAAGGHPWIAGTFRTLSLKSVSGGLSFHLAIGGAGVMLAVFCWGRRKTSDLDRAVIGTCGWLILAVFVIVLTPLHFLLYMRAAGLGILGLTVLAGLGAEALLRDGKPEIRWSRATWVLAALIAIFTTVLAHWIYPRFQERAREMMLTRSESDGYGGASRDLRNFQVANFANEVSLRNPECAFNVAGLALLAAAFAGSSGGRTARLLCALAVSVIPLLLFAGRFIVRAPEQSWERLKDGGPLQKSIVAQLEPSQMRLEDVAQQDFLRMFPMEISGLYGLHVTHGYAALRPLNASAVGEGLASADAQLAEAAEIQPAGKGRYFWKSGSKRELQITAESLNRREVSCAPGDADVLISTDTQYPGWTANNQALKATGPDGVYGEIDVPAGQTQIICEYRPSGCFLSIICALVTAAATFVLGWKSAKRHQAHS